MLLDYQTPRTLGFTSGLSHDSPVHCVGDLGLLKDSGLLAHEVEQAQRRTGWLSPAFFPADGRYFRHVEQAGKHRLADIELKAQRDNVFCSQRLNRRRKSQVACSQRYITELQSGIIARSPFGRRFCRPHQLRVSALGRSTQVWRSSGLA